MTGAFPPGAKLAHVGPPPAPEPPPAPDVVRAHDTRRMPKARLAMHLIVPRIVKRAGVETVAETKVSVVEMLKSVRLELDVDNDGIGVKGINLSLPEACALADMLNRIRHKVAKRPGYAP